jgi:predicted enzyme related to lactoylglutathione lyase
VASSLISSARPHGSRLVALLQARGLAGIDISWLRKSISSTVTVTESRMNIGTWFEIPATDLKRAKAFYEKAAQVSLTHVDMGPSVMEMFPGDPATPGAGGAVIVTEGYVPSHSGSVIYFATDDINAFLKRVTDAGGTILVEKMSIGEFGFIAQFQDSEGNRIGLHSMS